MPMPKRSGNALVSKPSRISFSELFFADLRDIFEYISSNFDSRLASEIITEIENEIRKKLNTKAIDGKTYTDDKFYKYIVVAKRKDVVFYHIDGDNVIVYRIFDQRRNFRKLLK